MILLLIESRSIRRGIARNHPAQKMTVKMRTMKEQIPLVIAGDGGIVKRTNVKIGNLKNQDIVPVIQTGHVRKDAKKVIKSTNIVWTRNDMGRKGSRIEIARDHENMTSILILPRVVEIVAAVAVVVTAIWMAVMLEEASLQERR
jgi:hypothetical protein